MQGRVRNFYIEPFVSGQSQRWNTSSCPEDDAVNRSTCNEPSSASGSASAFAAVKRSTFDALKVKWEGTEHETVHRRASSVNRSTSDDVLGAFSHWSHKYTPCSGRRERESSDEQLVCDFQGFYDER